jgi:hypothetical protein
LNLHRRSLCLYLDQLAATITFTLARTVTDRGRTLPLASRLINLRLLW